VQRDDGQHLRHAVTGELVCFIGRLPAQHLIVGARGEQNCPGVALKPLLLVSASRPRQVASTIITMVEGVLFPTYAFGR
jgi:hypothetical protein